MWMFEEGSRGGEGVSRRGYHPMSVVFLRWTVGVVIAMECGRERVREEVGLDEGVRVLYLQGWI